jgi:hypothetical protein
MLKVSFVVYDPHQTGSIRPPPLHCSGVDARPGLTTASAVTQTLNGWIRPAACASIGGTVNVSSRSRPPLPERTSQ